MATFSAQWCVPDLNVRERKTAGILDVFRGFLTEERLKITRQWDAKCENDSCTIPKPTHPLSCRWEIHPDAF